jgi:hypothetical protein
MIVTEEILAPYRSKDGCVQISYNPYSYSHYLSKYGGIDSVLRLPEDMFTPTDQAFRSDWPNLDGPKNLSDPRETLEIVLVLAFTRWAPVLNPGREWLALEHQCGGYSNAVIKMIATKLTPRPSVVSPLRLIAREGYGAEKGNFDRSQLVASRIASYVAALARIGLDCEASWRHLTESMYPIDATQANLDRVAENAPELASIAAWEGRQWAGYINDPAIFFLTENSD